MVPEYALTLACHPETPIAVARSVSVRLKRNSDGSLDVSYAIEGDLRGLRVPPARAPAETGREPSVALRLWEHTCCEMFIARTGLPGYHELNFSPSGEWAVYAFERYRERRPLSLADAPELDPRIAVRSPPSKLAIEARIRLDRLSPVSAAATPPVALTAVLEETDGSLSYWALRHPSGRPDFHHADGYRLILPAPRPSPEHTAP